MAFEFPETVTLAGQMDPELRGKTIGQVILSPDCASLIRQGFVNLDRVDLGGKTVSGVTSQGKWIFIHLQPDWNLMVAIESSGKVLFQRPGEPRPEKFRVRLEFEDGSALTVHIIAWGFVRAARDRELAGLNYPGPLGISAVDRRQFTPDAFDAILDRSPKKILKAILTDQRTIAGIGIGYLQEILYRARLHPGRKAGGLDAAERQRLYGAVLETLEEAVRLGGSALEVDLHGRPGGYPRRMGSHLLGQPCPVCGDIIQKVSVAGAACFVCPGCQH
jgi:formamidopyrimidine-DNA glycosylase